MLLYACMYNVHMYVLMLTRAWLEFSGENAPQLSPVRKGLNLILLTFSTLLSIWEVNITFVFKIEKRGNFQN
jgi:hypothetical protein